MNILKRPMFYAVIVCCTASVLSLMLFNSFILLLTAVLLLIFLILKFKKYSYIIVAIAILLFASSLFFEEANIKKISALNNQKANGKFLIISEPVFYDEFNRITLKVLKSDTLPKATKFLIFDNEKSDFSSGDIITATLKITAISVDDEYRSYNYGNGIYATANITDFKKTGEKNVFYKFFADIRTYVKNTTLKFFGGDTAGLMTAIITGDKSLLSKSFLNNVKETGISHVIVVSGLHLSIIMSAVFFLIDRLFYNKYVRTLLSLLTVFCIFGICGYTMSIVRAGAMFIISSFAPIFNREKDLLSSLLTAITVILIATPFAITNISFLLSVMSTLAIIWVLPFYTDIILKKFNISSNLIKAFIQIILASIFALIFTLPIIIKIFGYVSVVGPITNVLVTYPVTVALIFGCFGILLSTVPVIRFIGYLFIFISGLCCRIIVYIVNLISLSPVTIAILPNSAFWLSIAFILIIILYMYFYEFKQKKEVIKCQLCMKQS